jgi:hypothetical protein
MPVTPTANNRNTVDPKGQSQQLPRDQLPPPTQFTPPLSPKTLQKRGYLAQNQSKTDGGHLDARQA